MNIIEAIKTEKLIRRTHKSFGPYYGQIISSSEHGVVFYFNNSVMPITLTDILADDWETLEDDKLKIAEQALEFYANLDWKTNTEAWQAPAKEALKQLRQKCSLKN